MEDITIPHPKGGGKVYVTEVPKFVVHDDHLSKYGRFFIHHLVSKIKEQAMENHLLIGEVRLNRSLLTQYEATIESQKKEIGELTEAFSKSPNYENYAVEQDDFEGRDSTSDFTP